MASCGEASLDVQYLELLSNVAAGGPDGQGGLALETAGGEQPNDFPEWWGGIELVSIEIRFRQIVSEVGGETRARIYEKLSDIQSKLLRGEWYERKEKNGDKFKR